MRNSTWFAANSNKYLYLLLLIFFTSNSFNTYAQQTLPGPMILAPEQVSRIFTDSIKKSMNITYPVYRAYSYSDNAGSYYCLLTESRDSITEDDTLHHKIRAVHIKAVDGKFIKDWEMNDFIVKDEREENSIWFWTKHIDFFDYDKDGLVEPVIIYGTSAMNGTSDGRIKILIYYKGQKVAIRHQNGILDEERETQVDKAFYDLPLAIQTAVKAKIQLMVVNNLAIFPRGWETAMKNKKLVINERK